MYGWIWRKLPGGTPGKIIGSLAMAGAVAALLWFAVFPAVRPIMPWSNVEDPAGGGDGTVQNEDGGGETAEPTCTPGVDCEQTGFDPEDFETAESPEASDDADG